VSAFELKYCTADEIADADASREKDEKNLGASARESSAGSSAETEAHPTIDVAKFASLIDRDLEHYAVKLAKRALRASLITTEERK
jgi:hypothetical protein